MSTLPENELDLEKLFLPAWAQEPPSAKHYAKYEGEDMPDRREERRGGRPARRDRPPGPRREGNRPPGERRGPSRSEGGRGRAPGGERPGFRRQEPRERREPPKPLPEIEVAFVPDDKGVDSLARQIKMTGRAYPLFDIAQMILQKPERHLVTFMAKKKSDGQLVQPLYVCVLDDTVWLSEDDAMAHVLKNHFAEFYQADRTATEPPKGTYTFVAQCGMSGQILGPPNYHDYQNQLRKLHAERFSRMPFETFKARVKIVRDEEVVRKWIEEQSWKTDYICLNVPEPLRLSSRDQVEAHFRQIHKDTIIKSVESQTISGTAARSLRSPNLARLVRQVWEDQRRFPLQIATVLSQQFATRGLQFFKVNKTITHVSVARPHFLDLEATPVSDGVRSIVNFINANPKCSRRKLIETLAPSPAPAAKPEPAPEGAAPVTAVPETPEPTPEQTAVIADLHWLIHQGHVIEFANGVLETAKKPLPKPVKSEPQSSTQPEAAPQPAEVPAASEAASEPASVQNQTQAGESGPDQTTPEATAPAEASAGESPATPPEAPTENPPPAPAESRS